MALQRVVRDVREVYFVQGFELRLIKIGVTNDTHRRMVSMQTFSPDRLVVLGVQLCLRGGALEKDLHGRFAEHRQHGEWFTPAPELLAHIADHTVKLADIGEERRRVVADQSVIDRIYRKKARGQDRWLRANGFEHLTTPTRESHDQ